MKKPRQRNMAGFPVFSGLWVRQVRLEMMPARDPCRIGATGARPPAWFRSNDPVAPQRREWAQIDAVQGRCAQKGDQVAANVVGKQRPGETSEESADVAWMASPPVALIEQQRAPGLGFARRAVSGG